MDAASLLLSWAIMAQMSGAPTGVPPRLGSGPSQVPNPPPMNGPSGLGTANGGTKPAFGDSTTAPQRLFDAPGGTAPPRDGNSLPPFSGSNDQQPPARLNGGSSLMGGSTIPPSDYSGD